MTVKNGGVSLRCIPLWLVYIVRFIVFEPVRIAERLLYDRAIRCHELPPPVFVLGHWRSGTSYLQTLLNLDPQFTTSTIYRSLFSDVFLLTQGWLKPLLNSYCRLIGLKYAIQRTTVDLDIPAEADLGLCCLGSPYSYTWGHIFPSRFSQWIDRQVLSVTEQSRTGWLEAYDYYIRKLSYGSQGRGVVVKSPGDTARLSILAQRYPEAKFVVIHRKPEDVFHSNRYLWGIILKKHGLQSLDTKQVDSLIIENYRAVMSHYDNQREAVSAKRLVEVRHDDLCDDPLGELGKIYAQLGLGSLPIDEIRHFIQHQTEYKVQNYTTSTKIQDRLSREWSGLDRLFESV